MSITELNERRKNFSSLVFHNKVGNTDRDLFFLLTTVVVLLVKRSFKVFFYIFVPYNRCLFVFR